MHTLSNLLVLCVCNVLVALLELILYVLPYRLLRFFFRKAILRDVLLELLSNIQVVASGHDVVVVDELNKWLNTQTLGLEAERAIAVNLYASANIT